MGDFRVSKPKRVIIISILNIIIAVTSIFAGFFMLFNNKVDIGIDKTSIFIGLLLPLIVLISSILVLVNIDKSNIIMFITILLFNGLIVIQNAILYKELKGLIEDQYMLKIVTTIVRKLITIIINAWAIFSYPTTEYFKQLHEDKKNKAGKMELKE